jgi:uncharacterized membrane protein
MPMRSLADVTLPIRGPKWLSVVGWRTFAGALLTAGIVHILATLAVPAFTSGNAIEKLRQALPVNRMVVLAPPSPGREPLPFLVPDALYAVCRYDLSGQPLQVTAALLHVGWSLSLHTAQGDNFYAMPAQPTRRDAVALTVIAGGDKSEFSPTPRRIGASDTTITAPANEGLVIVRAPLKGLAWRREAEAALGRASCQSIAG